MTRTDIIDGFLRVQTYMDGNKPMIESVTIVDSESVELLDNLSDRTIGIIMDKVSELAVAERQETMDRDREAERYERGDRRYHEEVDDTLTGDCR
jgi:hypothetical protein